MNDQKPATQPLFCTICGGEIAEPRRQRQTATCSEVCKNRLDLVRGAQRAKRKCPKCLHPSSPQERELFRRWRASRGDVKEIAPIPRDRAMPWKRDLQRGLKASLAVIEHLMNLAPHASASEAEKAKSEVAIQAQIAGWKKLVDIKPEE